MIGSELAMTTAPYGFRPLPHLLSWRRRGSDRDGVLWPGAPIPLPSTRDRVSRWYVSFVSVDASFGNSASNDAASGSSSVPFADNAASPTPAAMSKQREPAMGAAALETAFVPPARNTRAKRVRIVRYHRQVNPERHGAALWRPDARAGPHPGGGFYGPPNINVGYINPQW